MTLENFAYRPSSAGHGDSGNKKREYRGHAYSLRDALGMWLMDISSKDSPDTHSYLYESALERLRGLENVESGEMNNVLREFKGHEKIRNAGMFLSAFYNTRREDEMVFDVNNEVTVERVGCRLEKGKRLVIRSDAIYAGTQSKGDIVNFARLVEFNSVRAPDSIRLNYGDALDMSSIRDGPAVNYGAIGLQGKNPEYDMIYDGSFGRNSTNFLINFGKVRGDMAPHASSLSINCGAVRSLNFSNDSMGIAINLGDIDRGKDSWEGTYSRIEDFPEVMEIVRKLLDDIGPDKHYRDVIKALSNPMPIWEGIKESIIRKTGMWGPLRLGRLEE